MGEVRNKGFELSLNSVNIDHKNFRWSSSFIASLNRNEIAHLYGEMVDVLDKDGNVIGFLYLNKDKNIKVNYQGERSYSTTMSPIDRQALAGVYELAQILSSITQIKKEMEEANLKIEFVKRKMQEREETEQGK